MNNIAFNYGWRAFLQQLGVVLAAQIVGGGPLFKQIACWNLYHKCNFRWKIVEECTIEKAIKSKKPGTSPDFFFMMFEIIVARFYLQKN